MKKSIFRSRFIAQNNISRKKNHVIIPLTPTSASKALPGDTSNSINRPATVPEITSPQPPELPTPPHLGSASSSAQLQEQSPFELYLHAIRQEARQRLKEAKFNARQVIEAEKGGRSITQELNRLFGMKK